MSEDAEFWHGRWASGQIGFHEGRPNDLLVAHVGVMERAGKRILVPLAGKALDLRWLAARGNEVVGVELVRQAIDELFRDEGTSGRVREHRIGPHEAFTVDGLTMIHANMLEVRPEAVGTFDAIYDRAALVAMEPADRERYVKTCNALLKDDGVTLLVTLSYDQTKTSGPPWSVDEGTVRSLYGSYERLEARQVATSARLTEAGLPSITETIYRIKR